MQTLTGRLRIEEASARLGITPQRLHMLREEAMQALVDALEPRPMGRPRKPRAPAAPAEESVADAVAAMRLREEIALLLPGRRGAEKKRRRRPQA